MRIKLDENIAASAAGRLTALGHDVHTVIEEKLNGRVDEEVWEAAQLEERFLITQDLDSPTGDVSPPATMRGFCLSGFRMPSSGASPIISSPGSPHPTQTPGRDALSWPLPTRCECAVPPEGRPPGH